MPDSHSSIKPKNQIGFTLLFVAGIFAMFLAACDASPTPDIETQIRLAVAATLAAHPTLTPAPTATNAPTPTPYHLKDLFCEYDFCIGHPGGFFLIDQGATRQPPQASSYDHGILFGYSSTLFVEMAWTASAPTFDPQKSMRIILEENEKLQGNLDAVMIGKLDVYYQPISTVSSSLPYGGMAAWKCADRDFIWKVYTPQDGMALGLAKQALEKFRCQEP